VLNVVIESKKKISLNERIAKEVRTVDLSRANQTAYYISKHEVYQLFRIESYLCDLQTTVHNVFYLLEINVKMEVYYVRQFHGKQH
jgi:hypothetical protein